MYLSNISAARRPLMSGLFGVAALAALSALLGGCATQMASFGVAESSTTTASLPDPKLSRNYALGAPPAAYPARSSSPAGNRPSYGAQPTPRKNWVWSRSGRGTSVITVQRGDSLYGIATRYKVAISELMAANRMSNPNVQPGQRLLVPKQRRFKRYGAVPNGAVPINTASISTASLAVPALRHRRRGGQENWAAKVRRAIASSHDPRPAVRSTRLFERSATPLSVDEPVHKYLPRTMRPRPMAGGTYRVRRGDTLYAIGRRTGVHPNRLASVNRLSDPSKLQAGMVLTIPR